MQLDAPAERPYIADAEPDVAHAHLQALLADAAKLADDDNLDDRSWAELIVRMVYSTSALRHLAEHEAGDRAPPSVVEPTVDLPPPNPDTLLATEEPPDIESPPDIEAPPTAETPVASSTGTFLDEPPELEMPYIPESRWRWRRGRHRVERNERNYDYFQDLRRVLVELEEAEPPVVAPAVDRPSTTRDVEASRPETVDDHGTNRTVPFEELSRTLAELQAVEPEPIEHESATGPVPFQEFSRALAELDGTDPASTPDVEKARDVAAPAGPAPSTAPWAEHMLLGALLVVAARRPLRRLFRVVGGE